MTRGSPRMIPLPAANRPVLSVRETAALLGIGESTVRGLVKTGKLKHTRIGKRVLIRREHAMEIVPPPT
jgi:excisionase family DNA binding protein